MTGDQLLDDALQDAACCCIEILEAVSQLMVADPGIQKRIVRRYSSVDHAIIRSAAQEAVPPMVAAARAMLRDAPPP